MIKKDKIDMQQPMMVVSVLHKEYGKTETACFRNVTV